MRFVTCEPTERPVEVKINAVMAKKKAVARAAISPMKFILGSHLIDREIACCFLLI
jgi:hypothetical protein